MRTKARNPVEIVNARIDSKKGHIRYLRNRVDDPTPILAEIKRRQGEIDKHQAAISKLCVTLKDIPAALATANAELVELFKKRKSLSADTGKPVQTSLRERIAILTALLEKTTK